MYRVDVIIPTYRPGKEFADVLMKLSKQTYPIHKLIVMNTEKGYWNQNLESFFSGIVVEHLSKEEFDHGGTRRKAAELSEADIMVFMTQDAEPEDEYLIQNLVKALMSQDTIGAAYARQLPRKDCNELEKFTRIFNYPEDSSVKTKADLPEYGIKTFFCSNVCAAYKKDIYQKLGGFVEKTIFNEDMIYAGKLINAGYGIAYAADAKVIHSHNYSGFQQLHRNFDLGVSQAQYPEVFQGIVSEGEGIRLVIKTMKYLLSRGKIWLIPKLIFQSGCKYVGYYAGKRHDKLSTSMILWFTMNKSYWS